MKSIHPPFFCSFYSRFSADFALSTILAVLFCLRYSCRFCAVCFSFRFSAVYYSCRILLPSFYLPIFACLFATVYIFCCSFRLPYFAASLPAVFSIVSCSCHILLPSFSPADFECHFFSSFFIRFFYGYPKPSGLPTFFLFDAVPVSSDNAYHKKRRDCKVPSFPFMSRSPE